MRKRDVDQVMTEMKRLRERVVALETLAATESELNGGVYCGKHTAAVKRASMDLTRALANLRR